MPTQPLHHREEYLAAASADASPDAPAAAGGGGTMQHAYGNGTAQLSSHDHHADMSDISESDTGSDDDDGDSSSSDNDHSGGLAAAATAAAAPFAAAPPAPLGRRPSASSAAEQIAANRASLSRAHPSFAARARHGSGGWSELDLGHAPRGTSGSRLLPSAPSSHQREREREREAARKAAGLDDPNFDEHGRARNRESHSTLSSGQQLHHQGHSRHMGRHDRPSSSEVDSHESSGGGGSASNRPHPSAGEWLRLRPRANRHSSHLSTAYAAHSHSHAASQVQHSHQHAHQHHHQQHAHQQHHPSYYQSFRAFNPKNIFFPASGVPEPLVSREWINVENSQHETFERPQFSVDHPHGEGTVDPAEYGMHGEYDQAGISGGGSMERIEENDGVDLEASQNKKAAARDEGEEDGIGEASGAVAAGTVPPRPSTSVSPAPDSVSAITNPLEEEDGSSPQLVPNQQYQHGAEGFHSDQQMMAVAALQQQQQQLLAQHQQHGGTQPQHHYYHDPAYYAAGAHAMYPSQQYPGGEPPTGAGAPFPGSSAVPNDHAQDVAYDPALAPPDLHHRVSVSVTVSSSDPTVQAQGNSRQLNSLRVEGHVQGGSDEFHDEAVVHNAPSIERNDSVRRKRTSSAFSSAATSTDEGAADGIVEGLPPDGLRAGTGGAFHMASADSKYETYACRVDTSQGDRSAEISLFSCARPHMRGFHFAWVGFFVAFFTWFAIAPLLPEVQRSLGLSKEQVWNSSICSVAGTIVFRIVAGPICDKYGARWVMGATLFISGIPCMMTGLVQTSVGLSVLRAVIGLAGSAFVTCQYWTSTMFIREVAGTANSLAAGWGNLGGGVTQVVMGSILFPLFKVIYGETDSEQPADHAWRTACVVPGICSMIIACLIIRYSDDCPKGNYRKRERLGLMPSVSAGAALASASRDLNTWLLFAQYACCFGVELTMANAAVLYFTSEFGLTVEVASAVASIFGWMNLFARGLGGFLSDMMNASRGMRGRLLVQAISLALQGGFVVIFAYTHTLGGAIVVMIVFSLFVQTSEGALYAVVPYVKPPVTGSVAGLIGAGGNVGGVVFAVFFRFFNYRLAFVVMGLTAAASSILTLFVSIRGHGGLLCSCKSTMDDEHKGSSHHDTREVISSDHGSLRGESQDERQRGNRNEQEQRTAKSLQKASEDADQCSSDSSGQSPEFRRISSLASADDNVAVATDEAATPEEAAYVACTDSLSPTAIGEKDSDLEQLEQQKEPTPIACDAVEGGDTIANPPSRDGRERISEGGKELEGAAVSPQAAGFVDTDFADIS